MERAEWKTWVKRVNGGRKCRWLETSVSYKSFNLWETGLNVSVEVIRKKGKGEMYNWLNSLVHVLKTSWPMRLHDTPHFQNAEEKNSMLYNDSVLKALGNKNIICSINWKSPQRLLERMQRTNRIYMITVDEYISLVH